MPLDIARVRKETPGCEHVLHFNNAGAALMPTIVTDTMTNYMQQELMQGGYEVAMEAEKKLTHFYQAASTLINAQPNEIAYIENSTRAWDMVFYSLQFKPGDRILTAEAEYASNYIAFLQVVKKTGATIEVIPNDEYGQLSLKELANRMDSHVKLIAITHVPSQGGLINPASEVGKLARAAGVFYLLDATQSVGQMPLDVKAIGCDALCATGRKFLRGPRGTGFLYVNHQKTEHLEPPFLDLHAAKWMTKDRYEIMPDARRFETWEANYGNKLGLTAAIDYALDLGLESIWERILFLAKMLRKKLAQISKITLHDLGQEKCGIVTFEVAGVKAINVRAKLRLEKMNVSVSLQEYARLDLEKRNLTSLVRASVHYYNTEAEIDCFCAYLEAKL